MPANEPRDYNADLRERLTFLMHEHSQAEVARRCGWSPVSVHNYTRGTRIPAEFCCALAEHMQVNPAWFLLGEGAAYLTQSSAETAGATLNLLELVKSLNAAMRMRLGALVGRDYAKALRELNEQLKAYLGLRGKLNEFFLPHYRRLLDDIKAALDRRDADTAGRFIEAALSVTSLCDDPALAGRLLTARALHAWLRGDNDEMLALQEEACMRSFASQQAPEQDRFYHALAYVASLQTVGMWRRAREVASAILALMPNASREYTTVLNAMLSQSCLELGDMQQALAIAGRFSHDGALYLEHGPYTARTMALWACGLTSLGDLIAAGEKDPGFSEPHRLLLLTLAVFSEDAALLERACRAFSGKMDAARITGAAFSHLQAPLLLRALRGDRPRKLLAEFDEIAPGWLAGNARHRWAPVYLAMLRAQLARVCGALPALNESTAATEALLAALPGGVLPRLTVAGIHCRNLRAAAGSAGGKSARDLLLAAARHEPRLARAATDGAVVFAEFQPATV